MYFLLGYRSLSQCSSKTTHRCTTLFGALLNHKITAHPSHDKHLSQHLQGLHRPQFSVSCYRHICMDVHYIQLFFFILMQIVSYATNDILVNGQYNHKFKLSFYIKSKKVKSSMARSLPVENLLPHYVGSIINYLQ